MPIGIGWSRAGNAMPQMGDTPRGRDGGGLRAVGMPRPAPAAPFGPEAHRLPYRLAAFSAAPGFDAAAWLPGDVMARSFPAS
jgi:hypothetical protein